MREAFGAKKVRVSLAPEGVLAELLSRVGRAPSGEAPGEVRLVALPELFEPPSPEPDAPPVVEGTEEPERRVVMVTPGAVRKNFLPAVLGPEGVGLAVVNDAAELGTRPSREVSTHSWSTTGWKPRCGGGSRPAPCPTRGAS